MSTASIPVSQVPAAAPNPLGRTALIVASIGLFISCGWVIAQPFVINKLIASQPGEDQISMAAFSAITTAIYGVNMVIAVIATILGIIAWRRPGRSKIAAALTLGMSGSALVAFAALLIGAGLRALTGAA